MNNEEEHFDFGNYNEEIQEHDMNNINDMFFNNNMNMGNIYNNNENENFMNEGKLNVDDDDNIQEGNFGENEYNNNVNVDLNNINLQAEPEIESQEEQFNNLNNMDNNENINDMNNAYNIDKFNNFNEINDIKDIDFNNMNDMDNMPNINNNFENVEDMNEFSNINIMNDINFMKNKNTLKNNNINNMNDGFIESDGQEEIHYQNKNSLTQQKLINNIENINEHFIDLEEKFKSIEIENKNLKKELANEKIKNRKIAPNNKNIYENSIIQGKIIIEDVKKKNNKLIEKINDLESKNKSLNYQLIEANQKIKKYENDSKQKMNVNENENNGKKDKDINEIIKLRNKIDEYEILISKLKFDKKALEEKIENIINDHNNEKKMLVNYKNSEIKACNKIIEDYQKFIRNNNININTNNNRNLNGNENVQFQKLMMELAKKDKIINSLKNKINDISNDFYNFNLSQQNKSVNQNQIQKLLNDNNELMKENEFHKKRFANFIEQFKGLNNLLNEKTKKYQKDLSAMKMKLNEYKNKVIILKKKICEQNKIINRSGNISLINYNNRNKQPIPSTPNLSCKISNNYSIDNTYFTKKPLMGLKNGNLTMNNEIRQFENSVGGNKSYIFNDGLDQMHKKSLENYRKFLSQLEQNMPNLK
jgi:ribosomal protein L36